MNVSLTRVSRRPFCGGSAPHLTQDTDVVAFLRALWEGLGVQALLSGSAAARRTNAKGAATAMLRGSLACIMGGGTRMLLVLTRSPDTGAGVCLAVGRSLVPGGPPLPRVVILRLFFDDRLFDGTVLDGELLRDPCIENPRWVFSTFDLLASEGRLLTDRLPLQARLTELAKVVSPPILRQDPHDQLHLRVKPCMSADQLAAVLQDGTCAREMWRGLLLRNPAPCRTNTPPPPLWFSKPTPRKTKETGEPCHHNETIKPARDEMGELLAFHTIQPIQPIHPIPPIPVMPFWARRTHLPDVYELHMERDDAERSLGDGRGGVPGPDHVPMTAGVPTLEASALLAEVAAPVGRLWFEHATRFGRWVPKERATGA